MRRRGKATHADADRHGSSYFDEVARDPTGGEKCAYDEDILPVG